MGEGWGQQDLLTHLLKTPEFFPSVLGGGDALDHLLPETPETHSIGKGSGCSDRAGATWGLLEGLVSSTDSPILCKHTS